VCHGYVVVADHTAELQSRPSKKSMVPAIAFRFFKLGAELPEVSVSSVIGATYYDVVYCAQSSRGTILNTVGVATATWLYQVLYSTGNWYEYR
jgi:hypothetical protein